MLFFCYYSYFVLSYSLYSFLSSCWCTFSTSTFPSDKYYIYCCCGCCCCCCCHAAKGKYFVGFRFIPFITLWILLALLLHWVGVFFFRMCNARTFFTVMEMLTAWSTLAYFPRKYIRLCLRRCILSVLVVVFFSAV